jgi:DNA-binding MarR family transcriptional regulator
MRKQKAADMGPNNGTTAASSENLAVLFHRAVRLMARAHHHHGHAEHAQMHVLALLEGRKSLNQRALQEMLDVRSASLSEILGKLEQRGFIERERDEEDTRNFTITVTGQGSSAVAAVGDIRRKSADALFSSLSGNERQQLAELLEKVVRALEKDTSEYAGHPGCGAGHAGGRVRHGHDRHDGHGGRRGHEHGHHAHGDSGTSGPGRHVPVEGGGYHDDE